MKTLKDLFDVPLFTLKDGVKEFVSISFNYWEHWLEKNAAEEPEQSTNEDAEDNTVAIMADLATVIDNNKAIAEKYQASNSESLLGHMAAQLASIRKCKKEDVIEEIKKALYVPDDKQKLLAMTKVERAEFISKQSIDANPKLVDAAMKGSTGAVKQLIKNTIKSAYRLVSDSDLKFALQHALYNKKNELDKSGDKKDA